VRLPGPVRRLQAHSPANLSRQAAAAECLGQAADYLASFKLAQVFLLPGDRGLEMAEAAGLRGSAR
jgi:hypothetical protein